jgi:hypothetical protein
LGVALAERMLSRGLPLMLAAWLPPAAFLMGRALMPTLGSETAGSVKNAPYGACPTLGAGPWAASTRALEAAAVAPSGMA